MLKELLRFHVEQSVTSLFKRFIYLLEDLREDHRINFDKLLQNIPEEFRAIVQQADYFDENKYAYYRKRVLDIGNETKRNINLSFERNNELEKSGGAEALSPISVPTTSF